MKDLNVSRIEMDELWIIIEKKSLQEAKLKMMELGCG